MHLIKPRWHRFGSYSLIAMLFYTVAHTVVAAGSAHNGFNLEHSLVDSNAILSGGPPKDGIPALDEPRFVAAGEMKRLGDRDRVLGLSRGGVSRAYPVDILNYHEIVNDRFGTEPVLISYCPLCGTGMAFSSVIDGEDLSFGVSGLLYNSDVLMYDRQTESLWSQVMATAISGDMRGKKLKMLPLEHTTWRDWRSRHPDTLVLSFDTGYARDYARPPYIGYEQSAKLYFPVEHHDRRYHPKEVVIGIEVDGHYRAYPMVELGKGVSPLKETINGKTLTLHFDIAARTGRAVDEQGEPYPVLMAYWFAWAAFHPESGVWVAEN